MTLQGEKLMASFPLFFLKSFGFICLMNGIVLYIRMCRSSSLRHSYLYLLEIEHC